MSRIRAKDTEPEIKLRKALWKVGLRYRVSGKLFGKPDLFFPKHKLAVFLDGCFWHGCPQHCQKPVSNRVFWENKINHNIERDRKVDAELGALGWKVIRFWEHQVNEDLDKCIETIKAIVDVKNKIC